MASQVSHYITPSSREKAWGLYVTGVGHATVRANGPYPPVAHPAGYDFQWERGRILEEFAILYILNGSGIFESAHQSARDIHAGDCLMLFPGEWHRYRPEKTSGWEEYWVTFQGSLAESWRKANFIRPQKPLLLSENERLVLPLFEEMLRLARPQTLRNPLETAALCHLLLSRLLSAPENSAHASLSSSRDKRLHEAGDYLRMNPEIDIDLARLARRFGMSYSTFRREFTKYFGNSPDRFHQNARTARLKRLLIETDLPLKEIAERLHFSSEFYMMQVFKRHTGLTPTQWRRRRETDPDRAKAAAGM